MTVPLPENHPILHLDVKNSSGKLDGRSGALESDEPARQKSWVSYQEPAMRYSNILKFTSTVVLLMAGSLFADDEFERERGELSDHGRERCEPGDHL